MGSAFAIKDLDIPSIGLYGACSTMALSLGVGAMLIDAGAKCCVAGTSSHFCSSERQFRFPLEYGGQRPPSAQWTVTGAGSAVLESKGEGVRIRAVHIGTITDYGITDAGNMGAAMAPAAIDTLQAHFRDLRRVPQDYDLIVLDVNLPDGNGFDFCREVKERRPDTAVIFLTANDMESDMLKGYELGAEDYVTKPFPMSVFQKKLSVVLGRLAKQSGGDCYEDGALSINFSEMTASLSGKPLVFTPLEYRLLKILTKNPQNVLTRQVLLEKLWDADGNFVDEHALTAAISRVRNKIETDGHQYIKTVYGMGYMWIGGASK